MTIELGDSIDRAEVGRRPLRHAPGHLLLSHRGSATLPSPAPPRHLPERSRVALSVPAEPPALPVAPDPTPGRGPGPLAHVIKRAVDLSAATILLALLAPLFVVLALLVRCTSHGPAFYGQTRVGRNGREFTVWKFRSMRTDAPQLLPALVDRNEGTGPLFKMRHDPRVTRCGRWMRRLSVDELPQLVNVALGQMSLIGPRPALPGEVASYEPHVHRRHVVRPGLTGLWQVSGRSDLDWEEAVRLDLRYVDHWSFWLEMSIVFRTPHAVLGGRGAY